MIAAIILIAEALTDIAAAIYATVKVLGAMALVVGIIELLFDPKGKARVGAFISNVVGGALSVATPLLNSLSGDLQSIEQAFVSAIQNNGAAIAEDLTGPFAVLGQAAFTAAKSSLEGKTNIQPGDWLDIAGKAFGDAVGFGLSSFAVSAAFESLFPEKLNTLNSIGPMLATMAGFEEVTRAALGPVFYAGIAQPARYDANSKFRSLKPPLLNAELLYSRRIITQAQFEQLAAWAGLSTDYVSAYEAAAFRPIQPRAIVNALQDTPFPTAQVQELLQDNGYSDAHVQLFLQLLEYNSTKNVRNSLITEAVLAYQNGVMADAELQQILSDQGWSSQAIGMVVQRAAIARSIKLAAEVEKSVVPMVAAGTMTPAQGLQQLTAAGVQAWYADLVITLATTKATVHAALKAATAEAHTLAAERRAGTQAAIQNYRAGNLTDAELVATLVGIGDDPVVAAAIDARLQAIRHGAVRWVWGQWLAPEAAKVLLERVAAIKAQLKETLITPDDAGAQLQALGVPPADANAIVADVAASKGAAADIGVLLSPFTGQPPTPTITSGLTPPPPASPVT
jgi:hypothetical protein